MRSLESCRLGGSGRTRKDEGGLGVAERQTASGMDGVRAAGSGFGPAATADQDAKRTGLEAGPGHPMRSHSAFTTRLDTMRKGFTRCTRSFS